MAKKPKPEESMLEKFARNAVAAAKIAESGFKIAEVAVQAREMFSPPKPDPELEPAVKPIVTPPPSVDAPTYPLAE